MLKKSKKNKNSKLPKMPNREVPYGENHNLDWMERHIKLPDPTVDSKSTKNDT